jgi:hypothetical protein
MVRRKGELTSSGIDRGWPHQVALRSAVATAEFRIIEAFCRDLSLCPRGHAVFHDNEWWRVYCFAEAEDAIRFMARFGGERFDPADHGRGKSWARWNRK